METLSVYFTVFKVDAGVRLAFHCAPGQFGSIWYDSAPGSEWFANTIDLKNRLEEAGLAAEIADGGKAELSSYEVSQHQLRVLGFGKPLGCRGDSPIRCWPWV
jgi:hypothetical protein